MTENEKQGVKILGAKLAGHSEPEIKSVNPIGSSKPRVLDKTTPQEQAGIEVVQHEEVITESDEVRQQQRRDGDPQVRIRHSPTAGNFEKIKRGEEDAY